MRPFVAECSRKLIEFSISGLRCNSRKKKSSNMLFELCIDSKVNL